MCEHTVSELAQALFCTCLRPTDLPTPDAVRQAVEQMLHTRGTVGCLEDVAAEAGDHPSSYLPRIRWCLSEVASAFDPAA
jgi:hypothetical protein